MGVVGVNRVWNVTLENRAFIFLFLRRVSNSPAHLWRTGYIQV